MVQEWIWNRGSEAYVAKVIAYQAANVAEAKADRNNELNTAAFIISQYLTGMNAPQSEWAYAEKMLINASSSNGYLREHGLSAARATIASGFKGGRRSPKTPKKKINIAMSSPSRAPAPEPPASLLDRVRRGETGETFMAAGVKIYRLRPEVEVWDLGDLVDRYTWPGIKQALKDETAGTWIVLRGESGVWLQKKRKGKRETA